jgi:hypothetical protein
MRRSHFPPQAVAKPLMLSPYLINLYSLPQHLSQQGACLEGEEEVIRCGPTTSAQPL